ncbi:hypothetical protein [Anatilimnocola floriformis]|uniref:hypothetical protein n=1 Tax=Anatilimnocola floriformis TaxID=2948575 RepID=UPI0020C57F32|nr:hypothetical protein [Anatilimnocola floriformis]
MKIQPFLEHHGIARNPFAEEDAQTDPVFKEHCIDSTYHPTWDKVYGDPHEPASSIVFGEKGSGKTAMRLQLARHLEAFNDQSPARRLFVVHYDDFNPFLDRFRDRLGSRNRRPDKVLQNWKLWDHMDAILTLSITGLVDRILEVRQPTTSVICKIEQSKVDDLDRHQARDLLVLTACYDQATGENFKDRWNRLRKRLKFNTWKSYWQLAAGITTMVAMIALWITIYVNGGFGWLPPWWICLPLVFVGWIPWLVKAWKNFWLARGILSRMRVGIRQTNDLRKVFMQFTPAELASQPLPNKDSTDDRYELLMKLQAILQTLGYPGIVVLVDRVDEPHLINGQAELMKALVWPVLDNKFLKHPGLGIKLMLPVELWRFTEREERDFYQRARLDKQNVIPSFEWTGEALYDVANARVKACAVDGGKTPNLKSLFEPAISEQRLIEAFRNLRVPRRLFKFLYKLLVSHCNAHTDETPVWQVSSSRFESELALSMRDQDAFDRGVGAG